MKFLLLINAAPTDQAAYTAYRFCRAALAKGHQVPRLFFYLDGVYNAMSLTELPADEFNLNQAWQKLAEEYALELIICVAAASRRGVVEQHCAPGFKISGLGQLIEGCVSADRVLTFNS